jgi:hypothetical protein
MQFGIIHEFFAQSIGLSGTPLPESDWQSKAELIADIIHTFIEIEVEQRNMDKE